MSDIREWMDGLLGGTSEPPDRGEPPDDSAGRDQQKLAVQYSFAEKNAQGQPYGPGFRGRLVAQWLDGWHGRPYTGGSLNFGRPLRRAYDAGRLERNPTRTIGPGKDHATVADWLAHGVPGRAELVSGDVWALMVRAGELGWRDNERSRSLEEIAEECREWIRTHSGAK